MACNVDIMHVVTNIRSRRVWSCDLCDDQINALCVWI